eukprot:c5207_g1_i1.p1 GENE.c5207_g1_i1~~c5207_g1_i1.p1  ORF type:complete len:218 (-),score=48.35 c5207_g1_i1:95-748(-)
MGFEVNLSCFIQTADTNRFCFVFCRRKADGVCVCVGEMIRCLFCLAEFLIVGLTHTQGPIELRFSSIEHADLWECIITRQQLEVLQAEAESTFIAAPAIFQGCYPVYKLNRKKVEQSRTLVLSTQYLYNIECKSWPMNVKLMKWAIRFEHVLSVMVSASTNEFILHIKPDGNEKAKDKYQFRCLDEFQKNDFVRQLKRLYLWSTKSPLAELDFVKLV